MPTYLIWFVALSCLVWVLLLLFQDACAQSCAAHDDVAASRGFSTRQHDNCSHDSQIHPKTESRKSNKSTLYAMSLPSAPELGNEQHVIIFADKDKGNRGGGKGSNNSSRRSLSGAGEDDDLQHSIVGGGENTAGEGLTRLTRNLSYWSISDMSFTPHETESKAVLTWKHLTVRSKRDTSKQLLKDVSGSITGGFWSLMGPSGSGKSTLVNTLACRLTPGMWFEGEIRMNGRVYSLSDLKCMSGYVMQDDLMAGALTVEETLFYAGELRLPREMTKTHRAERIEVRSASLPPPPMISSIHI